jgi:murein DD-endopeptidase MepM/ murein hydrolase activator NlpD
MSYRQGSPYDHRRDSGRPVDGWAYEHPRTGQPQPAPYPQHHHPQPRRASRTDYTLTHAGRQVRLGPVAFWIVVGTLVIMAGWSVVTGTYFTFHDDVLKRLIARQAEMQFAYEDRIAELRAQVDRITSRQLLDQEQFESKLDQLVRKQAVLESRATTLTTIGADPTTTGSVKPNQRPNIFDSMRGGSAKPAPINDTVIYTPPPDREARLESRVTTALASIAGGKRMRGGVEGAMLRMQDALDRLEAQQTASLSAIEENYDSRVRRMRGVLADLGIDAGKPPSAPPPDSKIAAPAATGGPYVAAAMRADTASFERQLYRISLARAHVDKLNRTLAALPVRKPVFGDIDMSSPFGMRMDPFVKGPAIHTGIDMRGDTGDPVRATATGTVTTAGVNGGYGKMVEIDHGNGLSTRYGHLSAIDVTVGQSVRIGHIIGKIGSTGRSTGPHLHYETRVDGEAVDPQKYLRAGIRLGAH